MLTKRVSFWGASNIIEGNPDVRIFDDVIFVPKKPLIAHQDDPSYGIYGADGVRLSEGDYRRGEAGARIGGADRIDLKYGSLPRLEETVVFGGDIILHYGHFILSSISRLWFAGEASDLRLLFQSDHEFSEIVRLDFAAHIFKQSGLDGRRALRLTEPHRIRRLIIPGAAFEEQYRAFTSFRRFCLEVGEPFRRRSRSNAPLYLSKSRLRRGISRVGNESAIEEIMRQRGVDVVYPEELSFADQVGLYWEDRPVIGSVGSAFHSHIFAEGVAPLIGLEAVGDVNSNFAMVDKLANRKVTYLAPTRPVRRDSEQPDFHIVVDVPDPRGVASALLGVLGI